MRRHSVHAMAYRICALFGKECASTCEGCRGTKHACTPQFEGEPANKGVFSVQNSAPLKTLRGENGRLLFSPHERATGFVCRHGDDAATTQWNKVQGTPAPKNRPGRPRTVTPADRPATRGISGP